MTNTTTQIQETIIDQVVASIRPRILNMLGLKAMLYEGENTVCFHFQKGKKTVNISVEYDYGRDTYIVSSVNISSDLSQMIEKKFDDIYCDQFADIFAEILEIPFQEED